MATLYELTGVYAGLMAQLEEAETEEEAAAIYAAMDGLEMDITVKAEAYAKVMKNKLADAEAYMKESTRLKELADAAKARAEKLKESIRLAMVQVGTTKIRTDIGVWKTRLNNPSCEVIDIRAVPEAYRKHIEPPEIPYTVDKKKANADFMLTGEIIPGLNIERKIGISFK